MEDVDATHVVAISDKREAELRRKKGVALSLLVAAGILLVVATWLNRMHPHWAYGLLAAMAEAALVGGFADWFAVVALFRHPMGQSWIPHTAIIPAKKDAIGASLADFICDNFLGKEQVIDKLGEFDVAQHLADALNDEQAALKIGKATTQVIPNLLKMLNSDQLHEFILGLTRARIQQTDLSSLAAVGLQHLTADGRHEELVDSALNSVRDVLRSSETREKISTMASKEIWPFLKLVNLDRMAADTIADKLITGMTSLVTEMSADKNHEMRQRIAQEVKSLIGRLQSDPALRHRIDTFRDQMLAQSELSVYLRSLWNDLVGWLENDVAQDNSIVGLRVSQGARNIGASLLRDQAMRDWINTSVIETLEPLIDRYRDEIRNFIVERIGKWSAEELTKELELSIGSDLQYIRYNGTAVGALIGGMIYGAVHASAYIQG